MYGLAGLYRAVLTVWTGITIDSGCPFSNKDIPLIILNQEKASKERHFWKTATKKTYFFHILDI